MNITDVGHLTSDQDFGEDKMEKGAKREGISVWEIADKYIKQFLESMALLNIQRPDVLCRATEHIQDQINLIQKIEANGFTYRTQTGLVFDTSKFPGYANFGRLDLKNQSAGVRVEVDPEKRNPWDFLLWVTNQPHHMMQWDSPWGRGFPGWHIECTAMSTKYLGEQFDIHTGGKEHIPVHHTNEIAQAFGAFGRQTANFWVHNEWLSLKGEKMSKSKGSFVTVQDLMTKKYDPLAMRYLILTSHYRKGLDFTWEVLGAAKGVLDRLNGIVISWRKGQKRETLTQRMLGEKERFQKEFIESLANDLNLPQTIAVVWQMVKSNLPGYDKLDLLLDWDQILGLRLEMSNVKCQMLNLEADEETGDLLGQREELRKAGRWTEADEIRKKIRTKGFLVEDTKEGPKLKPIK
jgi:cysteinyl-tRNA synthetase